MPLLSATNITHNYGDHRILDACTLSVEAGERVGLVGRNGAGKTTMLRVLAGDLSPDLGQVALRAGARRGYLKQDPEFGEGRTLRQAAAEAFADLRRLHAELEGLFEQMASAQGAELERLLARQVELEKRVETAGGFAVDHKIDAILHGLGFSDEQFSTPVEGLSGGQRARLALAILLLESPDVILLDEPTNHLDIDGRLWLEDFLAEQYQGAVVMIAHDRYLLDRVADRIVEVERSRLVEYPGNYTKFRQLRAERREAMLRAFEKEQTQFKREEAFIRKYKAGQRAKQARGRESRLERAKASSELERPLELGSMKFRLPEAERTGDIVLTCQGLSKAYPTDSGGEKVLFRDLSLKISRGERWGIIGPNGAGKTTLVRALLGDLAPDAGVVRHGSRLSIGYFRQVHAEHDPERPMVRALYRLIQQENPDMTMSEQELRDLAGAFLFSGRDQEKEVGLLSGGERARMRLAALLASAKNVLVLDEPTNHLDIPSAERLEEALSSENGYDGTVLLISHDRALIDGVCDHLLVMDGHGGAKVFYGNWALYTESLKKKADEAARAAPRSAASSADAKPPEARSDGSRGAKKSKYSWMRLEQVEEKMAELESEISEIDSALNDPDVWREVERAGKLTDRRDELKGELEILEEEWLRKSV